VSPGAATWIERARGGQAAEPVSLGVRQAKPLGERDRRCLVDLDQRRETEQGIVAQRQQPLQAVNPRRFRQQRAQCPVLAHHVKRADRPGSRQQLRQLAPHPFGGQAC
jgi:hypothetical protein